MPSTLVAVKEAEPEAKDHAPVQKSLSVGWGIFWMVVLAVAWNIVLVVVHNISVWLLG